MCLAESRAAREPVLELLSHGHISMPEAPRSTACLPLKTACAGADDGQVQSDSIRVIDMGTHLLSKLTGARLVVQLLVPGLEERARALPPLCSLHHSPGNPFAPGQASLLCLRMRSSAGGLQELLFSPAALAGPLKDAHMAAGLDVQGGPAELSCGRAGLHSVMVACAAVQGTLMPHLHQLAPSPTNQQHHCPL